MLRDQEVRQILLRFPEITQITFCRSYGYTTMDEYYIVHKGCESFYVYDENVSGKIEEMLKSQRFSYEEFNKYFPA